ncbi:hypothetical protein JCM11957_07270 [Caminibacter profundus]
MKKLLSALALGVLISSAYAKAPVESYVLNLPKESLSKAEIKDLLHMREEEKLARDVYLTLYKKWKLPVFKNISRSESWHMHMVKLLLDKYGLHDPVEKTGDRIGIFENKKLQSLYNELVEKGSISLKDALIVGATIEDLDIKDLKEAIRRSNNKDIDLVYQNLEKGSRHHMRAFVGILRRYGGDYTPQFISKSYFNQIISSKHEMGMMKSSKYYNSEFYGVVERVYTLPGLRKGIYWWMADVKTNKGTVKVAIAPTWVLQSINIRPGDRVEVKGYQGMYSFITCEIEDKTTGFEYKSRSRKCR